MVRILARAGSTSGDRGTLALASTQAKLIINIYII